MMELNTARMEKVRDFLNRRKVVISIRVLGVACMFISQNKADTVSKRMVRFIYIFSY